MSDSASTSSSPALCDSGEAIELRGLELISSLGVL